MYTKSTKLGSTRRRCEIVIATRVVRTGAHVLDCYCVLTNSCHKTDFPKSRIIRFLIDSRDKRVRRFASFTRESILKNARNNVVRYTVS